MKLNDNYYLNIINDLNNVKEKPIQGRLNAPKTLEDCEKKYINDTNNILDIKIITEQHHFFYGRPWCKGLLMLDILLDNGLKPNSNVLEFGCGALRNGIHIIRYIEPSSYFGSDIDVQSLKAGICYELPMHGLLDKTPIIKYDDSFNIDFVNKDIDIVIFAAVFKSFMSDTLILKALLNARKVLSDNGIIILTDRPPTNFQLLLEKSKLFIIKKKFYSSIFGYWEALILKKI